MLEKLLAIHTRRKGLEIELRLKREAFDESVAIDRAILDDLADEEDTLREEALLMLESEGKDSVQIKDKTIIKQVKQTKRIADPKKLSFALSKPGILESIGYVTTGIDDLFKIVTEVTNKKMIQDVIDKYEKVEGKLLDGVELQVTKYLTIRDSEKN